MNDFDLTFKRHPVTGDVSQRKGNNALLQSVRNIVLTASGDWKAEQGIGVGAYSLLGENDADVIGVLNLKSRIQEQITAFEPRVELKAVDVSFTDDGHGIRVAIVFIPVNTTDTVTFDEVIKLLN